MKNSGNRKPIVMMSDNRKYRTIGKKDEKYRLSETLKISDCWKINQNIDKENRKYRNTIDAISPT